METDLGSVNFCNDVSNEQHDHEKILRHGKEEEQVPLVELENFEEKWCNIHFDGAVSKEGVGASICIDGPKYDYI